MRVLVLSNVSTLEEVLMDQMEEKHGFYFVVCPDAERTKIGTISAWITENKCKLIIAPAGVARKFQYIDYHESIYSLAFELNPDPSIWKVIQRDILHLEFKNLKKLEDLEREPDELIFSFDDEDPVPNQKMPRAETIKPKPIKAPIIFLPVQTLLPVATDDTSIYSNVINPATRLQVEPVAPNGTLPFLQQQEENHKLELPTKQWATITGQPKLGFW